MKTPSTRRNWLKSALAAAFSVVFAATALAASVHFKSLPTFEDLGDTLEACISLAGLGNKDITVTVAVTGTAHVIFYNPGGNQPPGQNKVPISAVATQTIPSTQIKNGNVSVCLETPDLEAPTPVDAGAPNNNWVVEITDVEFATATVTVVQKGKVVLKETFQLDN
jgi:hypothetical protein